MPSRGTIWRRDERQFRPAGGADAFAVDRFAAGDAQGRQRDVEREPGRMWPRAAGGASAPRRWVEIERDGDAGVHGARLAPGRAPLKRTKRAVTCITSPGHDALDCHGPLDRRNQPPWFQLQTTAPVLFDRALLAQRQDRARELEPRPSCSTASRRTWKSGLHAVMREFADVADIWTPGEGLRTPSPIASNPSPTSAG